MSLFLFVIQVIIISLSGVLAPGPVMAATIAAGTKSKHAGIFISLGHSSIELPLLAAIILGMGFVFENHTAKLIIGLVGGAYLLWMGFEMFRELKNYHLAKPPSNSRGPVMTGLILSATNPYFTLWWATVGLNLAKDAANLGYLAVILFAIVHSLCDMAWLEVLSFTSYKGTKFLNVKNQKRVLAICAAFIMFFGIVFIYRSLVAL
ncbi:MAG: LysE family transporter [Phycisphaerae bacterium]|nr:LysE family transporter [Phycisphaerae bacterium]